MGTVGYDFTGTHEAQQRARRQFWEAARFYAAAVVMCGSLAVLAGVAL